MNPKQRLIKFLDEEILPAEKTESRETLAAYIVGELVGDYDDIYEELIENNFKVQQISDLASDLEWSNGSEVQLEYMWRELKNLIEELKNEWFLVLGFCRNYVNLVVDTKYEGQDILENKLYNKLFDLCICMEDSLEDNKQAELNHHIPPEVFDN